MSAKEKVFCVNHGLQKIYRFVFKISCVTRISIFHFNRSCQGQNSDFKLCFVSYTNPSLSP